MTKKNSLFVVAITIFISFNTFSQTSFPTSWLGTYQGKMLIYNNSNKTPDSVDVVFEFLPTDKPNTWIHRMTYNSPKYNTIVKDYLLVKPDSALQNTFYLDEKDGIVIQETLLGNTLFSNFSVAGTNIFTTLSLHGEQLIFQVVSASAKFPLISWNDAKKSSTVFEVNSYPVFSNQVVVLEKVE
jgi:hypothetical protein